MIVLISRHKNVFSRSIVCVDSVLSIVWCIITVCGYTHDEIVVEAASALGLVLDL